MAGYRGGSIEDLPVESIQGTIRTPDGQERQFLITKDGYQQWGADVEALGSTVEIVDTMTRALSEAGLLGGAL